MCLFPHDFQRDFQQKSAKSVELGVPVRSKAKLREATSAHMAMLEQNPERVISYFQDRRVKYAA